MKSKLTKLALFSLFFTANVLLTAEMEDEFPEHNSKQEVEDTAMQDETPIIDAIKSNEPLDVIKKIVSAHRDQLNEQNADGDTPLMLASRQGDENLVRLLLKFGPNVYLRNKNNESAIVVARGNGIIQRLLVAKNPSIHCLPPILKAIKKRKSLEQIQQLTTEYDVNQVGPKQSTALMLAAYMGQEETIRFLLTECNPNINAKNEYGFTALNFASNQQIRSLLKNHGAAFGKNTEQIKFAPNQYKTESSNIPIEDSIKKLFEDAKEAKKQKRLSNNSLHEMLKEVEFFPFNELSSSQQEKQAP
ncbi:MAG: ankyrin repeat domain-containing protein [Candidatus Babeliales bacterium]